MAVYAWHGTLGSRVLILERTLEPPGARTRSLPGGGRVTSLPYKNYIRLDLNPKGYEPPNPKTTP